MAKKKDAKLNAQSEIGFKDYLEYNNNTAGLDFIKAQEDCGHKLTIKGKGYIGYVVVESIYSYDVFASDENKARYATILQNSTAAGESAAVLSYCIVSQSAHILVKGDDEIAAKAYIKVVNDLFEKEYNGGKRSVGYPFRTGISCKQINTAAGIWNALGNIYGYSPCAVESYPYNSFRYLMQGNTFANMILGIELKIINPSVFYEKLLSHINYKTFSAHGPEKFKTVFDFMRNKYMLPYGRIKEDKLAFIIGEICARTGKPYAKVSKKFKCYKNRHDLTVTTLCDFINRRNCNYFTAIGLLGISGEDTKFLALEALAELNRINKYSYDYIMKHQLQIDDSGYDILISLFIRLHEDCGNNFVELCERFHIVKDVMYIRTQCNF